jgi:hypothetical protein
MAGPHSWGVKLVYNHRSPALRRAARSSVEGPLSSYSVPFRAAFRSNRSLTYAAQVEMRGLEPLTSALQRQRSPN